jgi:2-phospho-L-lactate guanylyltransferase (CobY/MobA/RfbA family)
VYEATVAHAVTLFVFVGGFHGSAAEELVGRAHHAIAMDTLEKALATHAFHEIVLSVDSPQLARRAGALPVRIELDDGAFHFGRILRDLIHKYEASCPFYIGGGSAPLLSVPELRGVAQLIASAENAVLANNKYSADFFAFTPGTAVDAIDLSSIDNNVPWLLEHQAGLAELPLARSAGTQLDIDTPTDLMVLQIHPLVGPHTLRYIQSLRLDLTRIRQVMRLFTDPLAEVIVAGRVGSHVWAHLETDVACRLRVFSEERGMRASGREERGEVYSLLGFHLQEVGSTRFFQTLAKMGQAALIDTRVLFHHLHLDLSTSDRFYSDLMQPDLITNPFARQFTEAAMQAPIPVVLGGHTLVAGGLWALIDAAWQDKDREMSTPATPA